MLVTSTTGIGGQKTSALENWFSAKAATIFGKHPNYDVTRNSYSPLSHLSEDQKEAGSILAAMLLLGEEGVMANNENRQEELHKRRFANFGSRLEAVQDVPDPAQVVKPMKPMRYGKKK